MYITLSVNARPSRPSGKSTVSNFLSSFTTTLEMDQKVNISGGLVAKVLLTDTYADTKYRNLR